MEAGDVVLGPSISVPPYCKKATKVHQVMSKELNSQLERATVVTHRTVRASNNK